MVDIASNRRVMKYTHFPEAENQKHPINRHWFIYRREASLSLKEERTSASVIATNLLFGEAKRNLLTRRYVCSQLDASTIAGYQLQISYGDYDVSKVKPGYLQDNERLSQLLPVGMETKMKAAQWESIITVQYQSLTGLGVQECRDALLEFARNMPCYGCSFFPTCAELPPSGFFEFRTQNWVLGIGPNGAVVIDSDTQKYVYVISWADLTFKCGMDQLFLTNSKNGKIKEITLITPQCKIAENLCVTMKYKWLKDVGKLGLKEARMERAATLKRNKSKKKGSTSPVEGELPATSPTFNPFQKIKRRSTLLKSKIPEKTAIENAVVVDERVLSPVCNPPKNSDSIAIQSPIPESIEFIKASQELLPTSKPKFRPLSSQPKMLASRIVQDPPPYTSVENVSKSNNSLNFKRSVGNLRGNLSDSLESVSKKFEKGVDILARALTRKQQPIPRNEEKVYLSIEDINNILPSSLLPSKSAPLNDFPGASTTPKVAAIEKSAIINTPAAVVVEEKKATVATGPFAPHSRQGSTKPSAGRAKFRQTDDENDLLGQLEMAMMMPSAPTEYLVAEPPIVEAPKVKKESKFGRVANQSTSTSLLSEFVEGTPSVIITPLQEQKSNLKLSAAPKQRHLEEEDEDEEPNVDIPAMQRKATILQEQPLRRPTIGRRTSIVTENSSRRHSVLESESSSKRMSTVEGFPVSRRPSILDNAPIQGTHASQAPPQRRRGSIFAPVEIVKRVNDEFSIDSNLGGLGPTQLLDMRKKSMPEL